MTQFAPQPPWPANPPTPKNGFGTSSLVLGIIGAIFALIPIVGVIAWPMVIVGLILGILGFFRARSGAADNKGVAIAGTVLSLVGLILCAAYTAAFASGVDEASKNVPAATTPAVTLDAPQSAAPVPGYVNPEPSGHESAAEGIGDGTHIIGQDMEPGTYKSAGAKAGMFEFCTWSTKSGASSNSDIIDFGTANANEPMVVKIGKNVKAFESSNCDPWVKQ